MTKLDQITSGSGGFLVMTGDLGVDDLFRLSKYFLQVLAAVNNTQIVLDPEAVIGPSQTHRTPFQLTEADYRSDVVLLSPAPWAIELALETPSGDVITAADAGAIPDITYATSNGLQFYRFALPLLLGANVTHGGQWHALLEIGDGPFKEVIATHERVGQPWIRNGVPYSLSVHARSSLWMTPTVVQLGHEPGALVHLSAVLTQFDLPITSRSTVRVEVEKPGGTSVALSLAQTDPGVYESQFVAAIPGVYHLRFLASGYTVDGVPLTREALRTAAVTPGGDREPRTPGDGWDRACELLGCLLGDDGVRKLVLGAGADIEHVADCVRRICRPAPREGRSQDAGVGGLGAVLAPPSLRSALGDRLRRHDR